MHVDDLGAAVFPIKRKDNDSSDGGESPVESADPPARCADRIR